MCFVTFSQEALRWRSVRASNLRWRTKYPEKHKANHENWRVENKQKRNEYQRNWQAAAKAKDPIGVFRKKRGETLKRRYGITIEEYESMLSLQGGHCALCNRTPDQERHGQLNVDHCHDTGRIRGLLCTVHNSAIAAFGDNEAGLIRAIAYIKAGA